MNQICPSCDSEKGIREILYGMPNEPIDESKYAIGGCCITGRDPIWACVDCGWSGWSLKNDEGTKLTRWKCPICESIGKVRFIDLDDEHNKIERKKKFKAVAVDEYEFTNAICTKCGWQANLYAD
jgi:hypothetical protein